MQDALWKRKNSIVEISTRKREFIEVMRNFILAKLLVVSTSNPKISIQSLGISDNTLSCDYEIKSLIEKIFIFGDLEDAIEIFRNTEYEKVCLDTFIEVLRYDLYSMNFGTATSRAVMMIPSEKKNRVVFQYIGNSLGFKTNKEIRTKLINPLKECCGLSPLSSKRNENLCDTNLRDIIESVITSPFFKGVNSSKIKIYTSLPSSSLASPLALFIQVIKYFSRADIIPIEHFGEYFDSEEEPRLLLPIHFVLSENQSFTPLPFVQTQESVVFWNPHLSPRKSTKSTKSTKKRKFGVTHRDSNLCIVEGYTSKILNHLILFALSGCKTFDEMYDGVVTGTSLQK